MKKTDKKYQAPSFGIDFLTFDNTFCTTSAVNEPYEDAEDFVW